MMAPLERLIESLRNELQQYGETLALLDQQQHAALYRGADDILHAMAAIQTQSAVVAKARQIREEAAARLARSLNQPDAAGFAELVPLLPAHVRPLVLALAAENRALLGNVRQQASRNCALLRQSVDQMQRFIDGFADSHGARAGLDGTESPGCIAGLTSSEGTA